MLSPTQCEDASVEPWGCCSEIAGRFLLGSSMPTCHRGSPARLDPAPGVQQSEHWWLDMVPRWTTRSLESEGFLQKNNNGAYSSRDVPGGMHHGP